MSSLLRALRKRLKANPAPVKPKGKFYPGTIESISIGGRTFPVLDSVTSAKPEERSITFFKPRSAGVTLGLLETFRGLAEQELALQLVAACPDAARREEIELMCRDVGRTSLWSFFEMRDRATDALRKGWEGGTYEELCLFELKEAYPSLFA